MMNSSMEFDLDHFYSLLTERTKMVAIAHASKRTNAPTECAAFITCFTGLHVPNTLDACAIATILVRSVNRL